MLIFDCLDREPYLYQDVTLSMKASSFAVWTKRVKYTENYLKNIFAKDDIHRIGEKQPSINFV